ncbi:MAG TPA: hypothetical protein VF814_12695 [Casimicrobiaceae bacterium]
MAASARPRITRREDLGLTSAEFGILKRLDTPQRIQLFVNAIPANHEIGGETILSVREVLRQRRAHCIEGAFVAACALWIQGRPPLVMYMGCDASDYPHVIALFRHGTAWGAISKHNGPQLRYRDPVYSSLRELAMSYFHEYFDKRGQKTLRSHSAPFDMRRIDAALWVTSDKACDAAHARLAALRRYALISARQERLLVRRDAFERKAAKLVEHPRPPRRGVMPPAWRG